MNIGKRIQELRKSLNLTQEQLAKAVGVSIPAVSKWETGSTMPDITLIAPIARKLNTDVNDLLNYSQVISDWEVDLMVNGLDKEFEGNGYVIGCEKAFSLTKQHNNNNYLKLKVANQIILHRKKLAKEEETEDVISIVTRGIKLLEEVYNNPMDHDNPVIRTATISSLVSYYIKENKLDEAEEILIDLPDVIPNGKSMLKNVFTMRGNYIDAKLITQREYLVDLIRVLNDVETLYNIEINQSNYEEAYIFASDYYTVSKRLKNPMNLPSKLIMDLLIKQNKVEDIVEMFSSYINEIIDSGKVYEESLYYDVIKESIQTWNERGLEDIREYHYQEFINNSLYDDIRQESVIIDELKRLEDVLV